ncbi:hypothetical protein ABFS83_09G038900 [Erythranthe nasuta]
MYCSLKTGFSVNGSTDIAFKNRAKLPPRVCAPIDTLQFKESNFTDFWTKTLEIAPPKFDPITAQPLVSNKGLKWWEKSIQTNMIEIQSAQQLVDFLPNAGDKLVVLDFYSPGCGGCKSLHPKISQLAETNPNALFLKINYDQHKAMCYALNVHVLPFFRFYRGAVGKACSFSCTNATIKKFKDALAKHGTDRCDLGPAKGLDDSELLALASIGLISKDFVPNSADDDKIEDLVIRENAVSGAFSIDDNAMVMA